jgi:hypothetical protein
MEHTAEYLSVIVKERMSAARCAAELEHLVSEARRARQARRAASPPAWRLRIGATLVRLGTRLAGGHPARAASPAC